MPTAQGGNRPADHDQRVGCPHGRAAEDTDGYQRLDEVTGGGLPRGRPTLVCGPAGCGKTLLAMEFLFCGSQFDEPGVSSLSS
jgi:circadian clock protein KaiC